MDILKKYRDYYNRDTKTLNAVRADDLDDVLVKLGNQINKNLLDDFSNKKFKCKFCKAVITRDNLSSMRLESGNVSFVCDQPSCVISLSQYSLEKNISNISV